MEVMEGGRECPAGRPRLLDRVCAENQPLSAILFLYGHLGAELS